MKRYFKTEVIDIEKTPEDSKLAYLILEAGEYYVIYNWGLVNNPRVKVSRAKVNEWRGSSVRTWLEITEKEYEEELFLEML